MKTISLIVTVLICSIAAILNFPYWIVSKAMGFNDPVPHWLTIMKWEYKSWRGIKPVEIKHSVVDGYLYGILIFEDGSKLYLRN
jgi:hypothetical protein